MHDGFDVLLHLSEDHRADLLGCELFCLTLVFDDNHRLIVVSTLNLEWPLLDVFLDDRVRPEAADEPLGIKHCVLWVSIGLALCSVSSQDIFIIEGDIRGHCVQALLCLYDLRITFIEDSNDGIRGAEINSDREARRDHRIIAQT